MSTPSQHAVNAAKLMWTTMAFNNACGEYIKEDEAAAIIQEHAINPTLAAAALLDCDISDQLSNCRSINRLIEQRLDEARRERDSAEQAIRELVEALELAQKWFVLEPRNDDARDRACCVITALILKHKGA